MNSRPATEPQAVSARTPSEQRTYLYADPPPGTRPMRIVLIRPAVVPRWIEGFLELAARSRRIELVTVPIEPHRVVLKSDLPLDLRLFLKLERALLALFLWASGRDSQSPLSRVRTDMRNAADPAGAPKPHAGLSTLRPHVTELRADLILLCGPAEWAMPLSECAVQGCWTLSPDLIDEKYAALSLLEPILQGEEAAAFGLQLRFAHAPALPLVMSWGATRAVSFSQHRDQAFLKLPALLMRALRQFADGKAPALPGRVATLHAAPSAPDFASGAGLRALSITTKLIAESGARRRRANQPWFLLIPEGRTSIDPTAPSLGRHRALVAPGSDYWADPFLVGNGQQRLLLVEEFVADKGRGVIACLELQADGTALRHGVVLDEPFHLSYPQAFQWEGHWYMTVESCETRRVLLYQADEFPFGWRRVAELLGDCVCVDPTLRYHDGHWYLFGNVSESGGNPSDELFLFVSEHLTGPYRAHPCNPIVPDVRRSRPAGGLFLHGSRLVRPAQCCAPVYGAAIVFNEVLELTPQRYRERALAKLEPNMLPGLDGCHTYNRAGGLEVLDAHGEPPAESGRIPLTQVRHQDPSPDRGSAESPAGAVSQARSTFDAAALFTTYPWYF